MRDWKLRKIPVLRVVIEVAPEDLPDPESFSRSEKELGLGKNGWYFGAGYRDGDAAHRGVETLDRLTSGRVAGQLFGEMHSSCEGKCPHTTLGICR